jgi:hypothetical protein
MPELTAEQRTAWRNALIAEVAAPRPARLRVGLPVLGAAALSTAVVVAVVVRPSEPERAPAMLNAAAEVTTADPVPGPGQYLRVRTRAEYVGMDGAGNGYVSPELHETFLPADRARPVIKRTTWLEPTTFFGSGGAAFAAREFADHRSKVVVEQADPEPVAESLPHDPEQLLDRLRGNPNPAGEPVGQFLFDQLAELLQGDSLTADGRAAAYRALALVPGISVVANSVVLDGATGTAFGLTGTLASTSEIVIDPAGGRYLGERLVLDRADGALPAGTLLESTAVTTSVVDDAPRPTALAPPSVELPRR